MAPEWCQNFISILMKFCVCSIVDQHMKISQTFQQELWSLIDVKVSFFLSILRNNEWILMQFCLWIDIYDPCCG